MGIEDSKFSAGDIVRISDDLTRVRAQQTNHGGWVDDMKGDLGKIAVVKAITPTGDVVLKIDNHKWVFNPQSCTLVSHGQGGGGQEESSSGDGAGAILSSLLAAHAVSGEQETTGKNFVFAAQQGQVEAVQDLLKKNPGEVNTKASGKTALHVASHKGHTDVVKVLLEAGASCDIKDNEELTALHCAVIGNRPEPLQLLLKKGADINAVDSSGDTPLHNAIYHGSTSVEEILINNNKCDFSLTNKRGFDVLQFASLRGDEIAIKLILAKHPDMINNKKEDGFTALHVAAFNGHDRIAKMLIEKGAQLDIGDNNQHTPLHLAVARSRLSMVELLVTKGANMNAKDEDGDTPLHIAVMNNTGLSLGDSEPMMRLLLGQLGNKDDKMGFAIACFLVKKGADMNIKNDRGLTVLDMIKDPEKKEALRMFAPSS